MSLSIIIHCSDTHRVSGSRIETNNSCSSFLSLWEGTCSNIFFLFSLLSLFSLFRAEEITSWISHCVETYQSRFLLLLLLLLPLLSGTRILCSCVGVWGTGNRLFSFPFFFTLSCARPVDDEGQGTNRVAQVHVTNFGIAGSLNQGSRGVHYGALEGSNLFQAWTTY